MKNKLLVSALLVGSLSAVSLANATSPIAAAAVAPITATDAQLEPMFWDGFGKAFAVGVVSGGVAGAVGGAFGAPGFVVGAGVGALGGGLGGAAGYAINEAMNAAGETHAAGEPPPYSFAGPEADGYAEYWNAIGGSEAGG
jgi:hypothetical protein